MKEIVLDPNVVSVPSQTFWKYFVTGDIVAHEKEHHKFHNNLRRIIAALHSAVTDIPLHSIPSSTYISASWIEVAIEGSLLHRPQELGITSILSDSSS